MKKKKNNIKKIKVYQKESDIEERLRDAIMPICEITCSKCHEESTAMMIDDYEWAIELRKQKWYATENNIYCPKCNLKRKSKRIKKENASN